MGSGNPGMTMTVGGVLFFFISTIFVVAYLATGTTNRLRRREAEVVELSQRLQIAYSRLQTLYESAQAVSSSLSIFSTPCCVTAGSVSRRARAARPYSDRHHAQQRREGVYIR